jgi:Transposase DDE domain
MKQSLKREVTTILQSAPIVDNFARKTFVALFVMALIQQRKVQFCELAAVLNDQVKVSSNQNRIEDFFREVDLNFGAVAGLMMALLPKKAKLRLTIDRTEWNFGKCETNILMILIGCGELQLPLYWEFLDNRSGNSNSQDRIDLVEKCFRVVDKKRIGLVVGDREFVGHKWIKYLKDNNLPFVMRLPKSHFLTTSEEEVIAITDLGLAVGERFMRANCRVDGCWGNVWIKRLDETEYLYVFGTVETAYLGQLYRKRWGIEVFFQNLKGRGFDLASSHLRSLEKLGKLVGLVSLAYAFCTSVGLYYHQKVQPVKKKKHGYKANSFARYGLNQLRALLRSELHQEILLWPLLQRVFGWLRRQLAQNQTSILAG